MRWPNVRLADVCDIAIGRTPSRSKPEYWGQGFPWLSIADMNQGKLLSQTKEQITEEGVIEAKMKPVQTGTVLFSFKLTIGKIGIAQREMFTNEAIAALPIKNPDELCPEFLSHALSQIDAARTTDRAVMGATLNKKKLAELKIPLPPFAEQKRIAAILDKADGIRRKREQAIELADQLLQSVFLDMFGDPITNPKNWKVRTMGDVGVVQGGLQVTSKRATHPIELPYLRVANVYRDRLELDEVKSINATEREVEKTRLVQGDVLIVEGHGNPNEIGRSAVWNGSIEPCLHQNHLIRFRCDPSSAIPLFVSQYINSAGGRAQMARASNTTSGLNTISTRIVKDTKLLLPPLETQQEYLAIAESIYNKRQQMCDALDLAKSLHASLSNQAFRINRAQSE